MFFKRIIYNTVYIPANTIETISARHTPWKQKD